MIDSSDAEDAAVVASVQRKTLASLDDWLPRRDRQSLVVGVSGGADSTCLLDALVAVVPDASDRLLVGHVDHRLRASSGADAEQVRSLAAGYGLRCVNAVADVPELMRNEGRGVEEAARMGRYRALRGIVQESGASAVLTGHTRDDNVETVLLHLLRGTGNAGLGGLAAREQFGPGALGESPNGDTAPLLVVRPLLAVSRADTVAYCRARGLDWREDESNADPQFLRNRVRGHLLPVLRTYNSAVDAALERLATVARDEDDLLCDLAQRQRDSIARREAERESIDLAAWRRLHIAVQRRIVRLIAADAGYTELSFAAVERALTVGRADGPPRAELGGGLVAARSATTLTIDRTVRMTDEYRG